MQDSKSNLAFRPPVHAGSSKTVLHTGAGAIPTDSDLCLLQEHGVITDEQWLKNLLAETGRKFDAVIKKEVEKTLREIKP